jgi:hypothetical protein
MCTTSTPKRRLEDLCLKPWNDGIESLMQWNRPGENLLRVFLFYALYRFAIRGAGLSIRRALLTYAYESPDLPTTRVAGSGKPEMVWF